MKKLLLLTFISITITITANAGGGHGCCCHSGGGGHSSSSCHTSFVYCGAHGSCEAMNIFALHQGVAMLNDGGIYSGNFKYNSPWFSGDNFGFCADGTAVQRKLYWKKVNKVVLAGSDQQLSYRSDSTEFRCLNGCRGFYRKLTRGKIEVYDSFAYVNESPGAISSDIVVKYDGQQKRFHSVKAFNKYISGIVFANKKQATATGDGKEPDVAGLFAAINQYNKVGY